MNAHMVVLFLIVIALAALAAAATLAALRDNVARNGGDFGSPPVAGHDAELRALIAARARERPRH